MIRKEPDGAPVTVDRLLDGRVTLVQPREGYRAAIDPVLLAAAIVARPGQTVLDLGCGTGAAALCLAARDSSVRVLGIEIDAAHAALAARSATESGVADRVRIETGDIRDVPAGCADHVMANPPYTGAGAGTRAPAESKARAHQETGAALADWVSAAYRAVRHKGTVTFIQDAARLDDLVAAFRASGFGGMALYPLWPKKGSPARRVIVRARKGVRTRASLLPGLVLHSDDGSFTEAAERVLRHAEALAGWPD